MLTTTGITDKIVSVGIVPRVTKERPTALYIQMTKAGESNMTQFARALALVGLCGLVLMSEAVPASTLASTVNSRQSSSGSGSCCLPSQVAKVEARMPIHPVNPQAAVRYVTDLKLVSVRILPNDGNASVNRPNDVNTIQYDFGYVAPTTGNLFVRHRPRYVRVIETVEQRRASGISITKVLRGVQTTPLPTGYYSPLVLVVAQPQRHLTFFVESNIPRSRLRLLGERLLIGGTIPGGRAPGSLTPRQALALCGTKSAQPYIYPHVVEVSGYLRVQRWKPSDPQIYGVLFGNGSVPMGAEYNARWVKHGGLSLGIPARLFHYYLSLTGSHPPVAWHGTLRCSGAFSRLHVEWLDIPLPSAGS